VHSVSKKELLLFWCPGNYLCFFNQKLERKINLMVRLGGRELILGDCFHIFQISDEQKHIF